jgi:hypothetical protein
MHAFDSQARGLSAKVAAEAAYVVPATNKLGRSIRPRKRLNLWREQTQSLY